ncbi:MAG: hypothetical protein ACFFEA_08355 [Candidatus Thorarchaeota archaeon]
MKDPERGAVGRYRDVSELRIQFQCEYRFYLRQKQGSISSDAIREGSRLHREVVMNPKTTRSPHPLTVVLIVIAIAIAGVLWVLG